MRTIFLISIICFWGLIESSAQCISEDFSIWENTWESCEEANNPNEERNAGHWIMYEFDDIYLLGKTRVWNTNEVGLSENGFKEVTVDYSEDGINWTTLGVFEFSKGTENAVYGGFNAFDFEGKAAKYVLLTANSNWGGSCFGLAEVKFNLMYQIKDVENFECRSPAEISIVEVTPTTAMLEWEAISGAEAYIVIVVFDSLEIEYEVEENQILLSDLLPNTFYEIEVLTLCPDDESELSFISFMTPLSTSLDLDNQNEYLDLSIIPNPARSQVNIILESQLPGSGIIQLKTIQGKLISHESISINMGKNNYAFDLSHFPDGVYLVSMISSLEKIAITRKIVLIK